MRTGDYGWTGRVMTLPAEPERQASACRSSWARASIDAISADCSIALMIIRVADIDLTNYQSTPMLNAEATLSLSDDLRGAKPPILPPNVVKVFAAVESGPVTACIADRGDLMLSRPSPPYISSGSPDLRGHGQTP